MAQLLWQKKDLEGALKTLDGQTQDEERFGGNEIRLLKTKILEAQGKKDEAMTGYEKLAAEANIPPEVQEEATSRLIWMKAHEGSDGK